jgi:hypothetical protein
MPVTFCKFHSLYTQEDICVERINFDKHAMDNLHVRLNFNLNKEIGIKRNS